MIILVIASTAFFIHLQGLVSYLVALCNASQVLMLADPKHTDEY